MLKFVRGRQRQALVEFCLLVTLTPQLDFTHHGAFQMAEILTVTVLAASLMAFLFFVVPLLNENYSK